MIKPTSPDAPASAEQAADTSQQMSSTDQSRTAPHRDEREELLADLLLRYEEMIRTGRVASPQELCRDCPELVDDFCKLLENLQPVDAIIVEQSTNHGAPSASFLAGRYKPVRFYAAGGLGQVFIAEDTELSRLVALKQLKSFHTADPNARDRFISEAELTGRLEHPGVVPVYGLGVDDAGRPFYAMRFLAGRTFKQAIQEFHAQGALAIQIHAVEFRTLLQHWIAACKTIAYAHERDIVHRDLKPGNIILGEYGETWVVDWGLAKQRDSAESVVASNRSGTPRSHDHTVTGDIKGTPIYMSPEQAAGRMSDVGPAADVYSLGVVLYELLSGTRPFTGQSTANVLDQVRRGDFRAPREVAPAVPRPLSAIACKAMSTRPADRYDSVLALAADVERWFADEPVSAYRESLVERSRRWLRRHRTVVVMSFVTLVVATLLLSVGFVLVSWERDQKERARKSEETQRRAAQTEHRRARAALDRATDTVVADFLTRQTRELSPQQRGFLRELLLDYQEFARQAGEDEETRAGVAAAHLRAAKIQYKIGETDHAEVAFVDALERYVALANEFPERPHYLGLAGSIHNHLCILHRRRSDGKRAEGAALAAVEVFRRLVDAFPAVPLYRMQMAQSLANVGVAASDGGRFAEAEHIFRRVLQEHEALRPVHGPTFDFRNEEARNLANLSLVAQRQGRLQEALSLIREAVERREAMVRAEPEVADIRDVLAEDYNSLAGLLDDLGEADEAGKAYLAALKEQEWIVQLFPNQVEFRTELARFRINYGQYLVRRGKHGNARAVFSRTIDECRQLTDRHPDIIAYKAEWARSASFARQWEIVDLFNSGQLAALMKILPEVEKTYRECIAVQEEAMKREKTSVVFRSLLAIHLNQLAGALQMGSAFAPAKLRDADAALKRAIDLQRALIEDTPSTPDNRRDLALYLAQRGGLQGRMGNGAEAERLYAEAVQELRSLVRDFPRAQAYWGNLGTTLLLKGLDGRRRTRAPGEFAADFAAAGEALQQAMKLNPLDAQARMNLGKACINRAEMALKASDHRSAAEAANLLTEVATNPGGECVLAARFLARGAALARSDDRLMPVERDRQFERLATQAVEALKRAYDGGYRDAAKLRDLPDLDPIKTRPEFQKLLSAMEKQ